MYKRHWRKLSNMVLAIAAIGWPLSSFAQESASEPSLSDTLMQQWQDAPKRESSSQTPVIIEESSQIVPSSEAQKSPHSLETTGKEVTTEASLSTTSMTESNQTLESQESQAPQEQEEITPQPTENVSTENEGGFFDFSFDLRVVPDFQQVHQGLLKSPNLPELQPIFESSDVYDWSYQGRYLNINQIVLYEMYPLMPYPDVRSWFQKEYGGLLLVNISVTNTSDKVLSLDAQSLQFYLNEQAPAYQSFDSFFPLETGSLTQVIHQAQGEIQPEQTMEGYVIYVFSREDLQRIKEQGYAVMAYQDAGTNHQIASEGQAKIKDGQGLKGSRRLMPLSYRTKDGMLHNQSLIADKVAQLWLANKRILSQSNNVSKQTIKPLTMEVKRMELTELSVHQDRVSLLSLDHLPDQSLLVSVEVELLNDQDKSIWIQPQDIELQIHTQQNAFDQQQAESSSLRKIRPKEKVNLVHSLLIHREDYQALLQDKTWQMELQIPTFINASPDDPPAKDFAKQRSDQQASQEPMQKVTLIPGPNYGFFLKWQPQVDQTMDAKLEWQDRS